MRRRLDVFMQKSTTPRLLLVTDFYHPHWTGISKSVHRLVEAMGGTFRITVLTVRHDADLPAEEQTECARIVRAAPSLGLSRAQVSLQLVWRAVSLVRNADIVLVNAPNAHIVPVALLAKLMRKRLVIFLQGDLTLPAGLTNRILERVFDLSSYFAFALADRVSTYTQDYGENSRVIKPFLRKFQPRLMPFPKPAEIGMDGSRTKSAVPAGVDVLYGFAGRFVEEKGFDVLFEAIPHVMRELPGAHFVFAGETNLAYEDFFERNRGRFERVRDHITMLGLLDEEGLADFYNAIDFIVLPSRSDCFPLVQAEAMYRGNPSIVSDIPGARVLVKQTKFGLIFPKEDARALADQLIAAARSRQSFSAHYPEVVSFLDDSRNTEKTAQFIGG